MTRTPFAPVLRTSADVLGFWTAICRPLGWHRRDLWFCVVGGDHRPTPLMTQIEDLSEEPDPLVTDNLGGMWRQLLDGYEANGRIAVMLCRPGTASPTAADRAWGRAIAAGAGAHGVPLEPLHLASDEAILPLSMDNVDGG